MVDEGGESSMSELKRVENGTTYRLHDASGNGGSEIGDTALGIQFAPRQSQEFALIAGTLDGSEANEEITPDLCKLESASSQDGELVLEYSHKDPDLRIAVHSKADTGAQLRKWLRIENAGTKAVLILDVVLEKIALPDGYVAEGGGRGWPILIKGLGFAAIDFPEFESEFNGARFSLEYYPAVTLPPGAAYETEHSIIQLASGDPMAAFESYVGQMRRRKWGQFFSCYSSHGAHEFEGPNERVLNEELDHLIEFKTTWRVPIEYFVVDYGYWEGDAEPYKTGDFTVLDTQKRFPGGSFDHLRARLVGTDMKLGMWFGLDCPGDAAALAKLQASILQSMARYGTKLIKLDIPDWDCSDNSHDHMPGRHARYQAARQVIDMLSAVTAADPEVLIYANAFTRSPWWLKHVDLMSTGTPDVSDIPAPSMRNSQIAGTDGSRRFFETDGGTCVAYSDSHYWSGKQGWRKSLLMSLARSNQLSLAGQIHLLDEDDRLFLQRVFHMRRVHAASFAETKRVSLPGGIYGYANTVGGRGIVSLYNPSWEPKKADMTAGNVGCDPSVRNVCIELFPEKKALEIPAGGSLHARMEPWEVSWFEVGPSDEQCDPPETPREGTKNCPLLVNAVALTTEVADVMPLPVEQVLFETGSMFRCTPVLPRSWQGFPIMVDRKRVDGELYINNRPMVWHDGAPYALLYPWTQRYGMLKFGKENVLYLATDDTELVSQGQMVFSALPYYSSSAAREGWPYKTDATVVVSVKFLKDDQPYRHSHDPRTVRCSAWVDGKWTDLYRVPPNVPRIRSKFSWAVFMHDLTGDWECVRVVVPRLIDCDYEVEVFLTNRTTAAEYWRGD
jgi:hypothetical protein